MPKTDRTPEETVEETALRKPLSPKNQRKLWARYIALRTVLKRKGLLTEADEHELLVLEAELEQQIHEKNVESVRRELGLEEGG